MTPAAGIIAACGSDGAGEPSTTGGSLPPLTEPTTSEPTIAEPAPAVPDGGSVEAVIEFGYYGGFTTREVAFQMQPQLMVTSDGRVITPAPTPAIYPGPLLPADNIQTISQEGIDVLIDAAREAGMLVDVTYDVTENIADASTATLRLVVDGTTYTHEAYALGIGGLGGDLSEELGGDTPTNRKAFEDFANQLGDYTTVVGADSLGAQEQYQPSAFQLLAEPVGDPTGLEKDATVVDWPTGAGVSLAETTECVEVDAENVGDVLRAATQLTFFVEDGTAYRVIARPAYPGRTC